MHEKNQITREDLDGLLGRFSSDTEEAAAKYEQIRRGLINFFYFRGSIDPESLADETINRVAAKLPVIQTDDNFRFADYFFSFANKIYLEDCKKRKKFVPVSEIIEPEAPENEEMDAGFLCMKTCLEKHPPEEGVLIIKYYGFRKRERAEQRKQLAEEQKIDVMALHTKISRIKKVLRECLKNCLNGKKM